MNIQVSNLRQWDDLPLVLTTSEVAEVFRLQRQTVTRMLVAGRLHGVKTGKDWRVARVEVERLMNVTREQAGPAAATSQQTGDELTLAEVDAETWANDPMTKLIGAFAGGPADLSSRHHEYSRSAGR